MADRADEVAGARAQDTQQYQVVARRYRPRTFDDLVGQQPVAQALRNAILANRVGHAYLFTGARGVGKTSTARILAKALNCRRGPSPTPDNTCDICRGIDVGEDVDVLEIDGASNRGIEEIRQLRSTIHTRPTRARYKIYIIDEVHMLTTPAFNALLKTLEEPPDHVKFIFCTTDPEKIPITVLSRCQRYDFAPIETDQIRQRLEQIVQQEGLRVDAKVLEELARRAAGSMRDSQSLLEQLLAFAGDSISVEDLHTLLGTADYTTLETLAGCLLDGQVAQALQIVDAALRRGTDAGHLAEQLLTYFRDMLVAASGGGAQLALMADSTTWQALAERGRQMGMESLLAIVQVLDHSLVRMRQSTQSRVLLELAILRIALLPRLEDLSAVVDYLKQGAVPAPGTASAPSAGGTGGAAGTTPASGVGAKRGTTAAPVSEGSHRSAKTPPPDSPQKKTSAAPTNAVSEQLPGPASSAVASHDHQKLAPCDSPSAPLTTSALSRQHNTTEGGIGTPGPDSWPAQQLWWHVAEQLGGLGQQMMQGASRVEWQGADRLVVLFPANYLAAQRWCQRQDRKSMICDLLRQSVGRSVELVIRQESTPAPASSLSAARPVRSPLQTTAQHPLVRKAMELFDGELVRVQAPSTDSVKEPT